MLSLLLRWTLPNATGSVSPFLFHPFASTNALFSFTKVSCTVGLCLWWRLAGIIASNDKWCISVQCYKSWVIDRGGFVLHPFSCQVAYICSILPKYFPFTVCFYISLFLGLYEGFVSIVSTAPYNIVIVSLMNRSFMFLFWAFQ